MKGETCTEAGGWAMPYARVYKTHLLTQTHLPYGTAEKTFVSYRKALVSKLKQIRLIAEGTLDKAKVSDRNKCAFYVAAAGAAVADTCSAGALSFL